jgi:hypothetical protein
MTIVTPTGIVGINSITSLVNDITFSTSSGGSLTANGLSFTSINGGPLAGFRNAIINGNFDVWQRGTSFTNPADSYTADRWVSSRLNSTYVTTRQPFTPGQTDVPGNPSYFCRSTITSSPGANSRADLQIRIEGVQTFAGETITFSFWAKADSTKTIAIEYVQIMGSGGSPSTNVNSIGVTKRTLSTSWQRITATTTIPSISGKTIGTNQDDYLVALIWFDAGSDYNGRTDSLGQQSGTFDIAQVQLELGTETTPFERRPIGQEISLCQRYYQRYTASTSTINTTAYLTSMGYGVYNGPTEIFSIFQFPVQMRKSPTFTFSNIADFDIESFDVQPSSLELYNSNPNFAVIRAVDPSTRVQGYAGIITCDVIGGWFAFSAEF